MIEERTSLGRTTYTWDQENRLLNVLTPGFPAIGRTTYTYEPSGLRRSADTGGGLVTYIWDGGDYLMEKS